MPTTAAICAAAGLARRNLRRDRASGEIRLVLAALVVAVAAMTAIGAFNDRVRRALAAEAGVLLGGDVAVESAAPIPATFAAAARDAELAVAHTLSFRSVVAAGGRLELAEVKAVGPGYPLRGRVAIAPAPFAPERELRHGPPPGQVWVEPRLLPALGIEVGDRLDVGAASLRVAGVIAVEPDRGGDLFNIAPRVLMALADVPATELLGPGSRVTHRLLAAGPAAAAERFRAWAEAHAHPGITVRTVREARPELDASLRRAERFLTLAALVAVIVAGIAIATAAGRYAARHYDAVAVMRALGAGRRLVLGAFALELAVVGGAGGLLGTAAGLVAQQGLAWLLADLARASLPAPGAGAAIAGALTAPIALAGFALPSLARLGHVPPGRVLRRELAPPSPRAIVVYGAPALAVLALAPWSREQTTLTAWVVGGALGAVALLAAAAWLLVRIAARVRGGTGGAWRFGLANLARRGGASVVQAVALGLGLTVLLLLGVVRGDLLTGWRASLPPDAPNVFLINVQPEDVEPLRRWLDGRGVPAPVLHPMVRGRLEAVNGAPIDIDAFDDPRARRLAAREFNLSWARTLRADNRVVAGRWWPSEDAAEAQLSVEAGVARTLGLTLGDRLRFRVAGEPLEASITSLREVDWDSFNVNFFVLAPPGLLEGYPATWITAFHLPAGRETLLVELVRRFPSITVIDVDALMRQVRRVMDRVTLAVEAVFGFTVLAGVTVLFAALAATHDQRRREAAVLRALGARDAQIRAGLLAELAALGLVCGLAAAITAAAAGAVLATQIFHVPYRPSPWLAPLGALAGTTAVTGFGWLGVRGVLKAPAIETLRR